MKAKEKTELIAIGEALIDFLPEESGQGIQDVSAFLPAVGGAPANVCGAFSKLGGKSKMITQLGQDPFGDKIINEFQGHGIGSAIIDMLLKYVEEHTPIGGRASVQLIAEKGKEDFYINRGFKLIPHEFCGSGMRKIIRK